MAEQPVVGALQVRVEALGVEDADEKRDREDGGYRVQNEEVAPAHDAALVGIGRVYLGGSDERVS